MSTVDPDKTKRDINAWVRIARHELITALWQGGVALRHFSENLEFIRVQWREIMFHHALEKLSKKGNKIDEGYFFLNVFIHWWHPWDI